MKVHVAWICIAVAAFFVGTRFAKKEIQIVEKPVEIVKTKEVIVTKPIEVIKEVPKDVQKLAAQFTTPLAVAGPAAQMPVPGNSAIMSYLGVPVQAPANLDRRYSPEEISAVFRDLTETLGIKVDKLAVDTTEFPFVIHGRVESAGGAGFFKKIDSELRALSGYTYGGSVTGSTRDGSTYFALNMTPSSAYPREHAEAIRRRLLLRLQMVAAAWGESPP